MKGFEEVTKGYTHDEARAEANRCLECRNEACVSGCPVQINIPGFIHEIKEGRIEEAYNIIQQSSCLPAVCGRVCPQETQCEAVCVRGRKGKPVSIGKLERYVADTMAESGTGTKVDRKEPMSSDQRRRVAIIGSGPAGLSCAGQLIDYGHEVTVFEALHEYGGVLTYGIPEFRLPKAIVQGEVRGLREKGVEFEKNVIVGKTVTLDDLEEEGYTDIFIGTGAGLPRFMHIEGENLLGVYSANEFLTRVNLMKAYEVQSSTPIYVGQHVAVIGGGNVAMDAARCAIRMGAETVTLVYRRSEEEMPARREEVVHAKQEGIKMSFLTNPIAIHGNEEGFVTHMTCVSMALGEPDDAGRRRPIEIEGSEHKMPVDTVIMAVGTMANPMLRDMPISLNSYGLVETDNLGQTSRENIYAGGDVVSGAATVIEAMGAGKLAAFEIHKKSMSSVER